MRDSGARKVFNMIIALIIAIALWAYVVIEVNPTSTTTIKNVPILYEGESELEEHDMTIISDLTKTLNVTLAGQRSRLSQLKSSSVTAICDLSTADIGENRISVNIIIPEGTKIETQTVKNVIFTVERVVTEKKPIYGRIINQDKDSDIAKILSISKDTVLVSGAESYVAAVSAVRATVDATLLGNEVSVMEVGLEPVDREGNIIEGVTLGRASVTCRAVLEKEEQAVSESDISASESDIEGASDIDEDEKSDEDTENEERNQDEPVSEQYDEASEEKLQNDEAEES